MRAEVSQHFLADPDPDSPGIELAGHLQPLILQFRDCFVPLVRSATAPSLPNPEIATLLNQPPGRLFPCARCPEGALAGLLLFAGHWSMAHELVDDLQTADACYWHAIIHRMEPDTWNSDYWFRQVGYLPLFTAVLQAGRRLAATHPNLGLRFDQEWNPWVFNAWCDQARKQPQTERSLLITAIHSAECHLLWNYSREKSS